MGLSLFLTLTYNIFKAFRCQWTQPKYLMNRPGPNQSLNFIARSQSESQFHVTWTECRCALPWAECRRPPNAPVRWTPWGRQSSSGRTSQSQNRASIKIKVIWGHFINIQSISLGPSKTTSVQFFLELFFVFMPIFGLNAIKTQILNIFYIFFSKLYRVYHGSYVGKYGGHIEVENWLLVNLSRPGLVTFYYWLLISLC